MEPRPLIRMVRLVRSAGPLTAEGNAEYAHGQGLVVTRADRLCVDGAVGPGGLSRVRQVVLHLGLVREGRHDLKDVLREGQMRGEARL
jgi:hypothetical protein